MKSIMNTLIKGIVDIVKLIIVILAVFYAFDSGLVERIIDMF
jgi:hypothetical protein